MLRINILNDVLCAIKKQKMWRISLLNIFTDMIKLIIVCLSLSKTRTSINIDKNTITVKSKF